MPTVPCIEIDARLHAFLGRYHDALKKDESITEADSLLLNELIIVCKPRIPEKLQEDLYSPTCFFTAVRKKEQRFEFHAAFQEHNIMYKFLIDPPRYRQATATCVLYVLDPCGFPKEMKKSKLEATALADTEHMTVDLLHEEWTMIDSKQIDSYLMPPPPLRRRSQ